MFISCRFTRSLQSFEKAELSQVSGVLSQSLLSPLGVTTRLRRQSLIVGKNIPKVSFSVENSSLSESLAKANSTYQTSKRLSSSKLVTVTKSSESVSKMSLSNMSTPPITRTRKKSVKESEMEILTRKAEKSSDVDEVEDKDNTDNLLDVDEISAIIDDLRDNSKRKLHVSIVDPEKKTKFIKVSNQHPETNPRRSPRLAKMRRTEAENKMLNMNFQSLPNKRHRKRKAKTNTEEETAAKSPIVISEEFREEITEVLPERVDTVQNEISKRRKSSRLSAKRGENELEINAKNATINTNVEYESLTVKNTSQDITNIISEVERDTETKIVSEKMKEAENENHLIISEQIQTEIGSSLEDENIKKNADQLVASKQKSNFEEEKEILSEQIEVEQGKAKIAEIITRRVTRQMASTEGKEEAEKLTSERDTIFAEEKLLQEGEKNSSLHMKVMEPKNTSHLSSKSTKTKKSITYRKLGNTISSLHKFTPAKTAKKKITSQKASLKGSKISQRKLTPLRGVHFKKINQKKIVTGEDETVPSKKKKADIEKKPQQSVIADDAEKQKSTEENVELLTCLEKKTIQPELQSKEAERDLTNQKVLVTTEISTNGAKRKLIAEKSGLFSSPLLSSTPDITKKPKIDDKTSFPSKLHKTVSNLSPFSVRSFEYSRTSVLSANNQTIEESVLLQKVEHNKVNKENNENKLEMEDDETKMKVGTDFVSMEIGKKVQKVGEEMSPIEKNVHYESLSEVEVAVPDKTVEDETHNLSQNDPEEIAEDTSDKVKENKDVLAVIDQEKENMQCEERSPIEKDYESESEIAVPDMTEGEDESHISEKEDLCAITKSIHYESQQSETEDEMHNMSQDDQDKIADDVVAENKDVLAVIDQEKENMQYEEEISPIKKNRHYESESEIAVPDMTEGEDESQISEKEDLCAITKSIHYESQQSETEDEMHNMSQDDQDKIADDVVAENKDVLAVIDQEKENMQYEEEISPIKKNRHYESESEIAVPDMTEGEDESQISEKEDLCAITKSIHYESQQSETEDEMHNMSQDDQDKIADDVVAENKDVLAVIDQEKENMQYEEEISPIKKNRHYESESEIAVPDMTEGEDESQISEKEDLCAITKSIHYESQQSETEDEMHNMSQDDQDKIADDVVAENKDVLAVIDQEKENMQYEEDKIAEDILPVNNQKRDNVQYDDIKYHDESQQLEIEDHNLDIVVKKLHYESQLSVMSVSDVKDFELSMGEEKEKPDENIDIDVDYNASYSNYGLRCIIL